MFMHLPLIGSPDLCHPNGLGHLSPCQLLWIPGRTRGGLRPGAHRVLASCHQAYRDLKVGRSSPTWGLLAVPQAHSSCLHLFLRTSGGCVAGVSWPSTPMPHRCSCDKHSVTVLLGLFMASLGYHWRKESTCCRSRGGADCCLLPSRSGCSEAVPVFL